MKINFIFRKNVSGRPSIHRNFEPLMHLLKEKGNEITEVFLPFDGGQPWNIIRNLLYLRKHRIKDGVNHVTGDIHYSILALLGYPSVLTIHDDYQVRGFSRWSLHFFYRWLFWIFLPLRFAKRVVCITPQTKKAINHYYNSGNLLVITHHDMTSDFPYTPKYYMPECPVVFHMGTAPNKNLETTLKALAGVNCQLRVLKPMTEKQHALAKELGLKYVNRYDLSNQEVFEEYKMADVILFPSLYEGLGMPILEGQSIGRPIITTNRDPMRWIAGDGGAILLNDPLDIEEMRMALARVFTDSDLRNRLIMAGRENIKRFTLDNAYAQYMKVYEEAMK